jgi:hypothetical protein
MIELAEDDPLADEWAPAVIGPHFAGLLTARHRNAPGQGDESLLLGLSYHRPTVLRGAGDDAADHRRLRSRGRGWSSKKRQITSLAGRSPGRAPGHWWPLPSRVYSSTPALSRQFL